MHKGRPQLRLHIFKLGFFYVVFRVKKKRIYDLGLGDPFVDLQTNDTFCPTVELTLLSHSGISLQAWMDT